MNTPSTDPRAQRWATFAKYAAIALVGFFVAPYIFTAITGLAGLVAAGAIMLTTWALLPVAESFAANMRLKLVKGEAARNPVETLHNDHRQQTAVLNERLKGIDEMAGAVRTLDEVIDRLESEFPDSPELPQLRADHEELVMLEKHRRSDWQEARVTLGLFENEIKRVSRLWDVAQAAARARKSSGLTEGEWMNKLKSETAITAIRTNLNTQLAALSSEKMQSEADRILKGRIAAKALPAPTGNVIEIGHVKAAKKIT